MANEQASIDGMQPENQNVEADESNQEGLEVALETTLVEVSPGLALVFGEVPTGLELLDLPLMPESDRLALTALAGAAGNLATVGGNLSQSAKIAKHYFRPDNVSQNILDTGGKLASKDGAYLGGIFTDGDLVRQVRWIPADPVTMASSLAAAGPALAMAAMQKQIDEVQDLVVTNIELSKQTLKTIRNQQWSELEALVQNIDSAFQEATQVGTVTNSVWEPISDNRVLLNEKHTLYKKNVIEHVKQLRSLEGDKRRAYLEREAEAIVFDSYALLSSLKAYSEFQTLRAAQVRNRIDKDENERQLFKLITESTPREISEGLNEARELISELTRELRIISELPGRFTVPLSKKRKDKKATALTCKELLEAMEPVANIIQPKAQMLEPPKALCAPEKVDLRPYLNVLRWYMDQEEPVQALAFAYAPKKRDVAGVVPALLAKRVDATWDSLDDTFGDSARKVAAPSTLVAVTDSRILVADAENLVRQGQLKASVPLETIRLVRTPAINRDSVRPTLEIITDTTDVQLMFPKMANTESVAQLVRAIQDWKKDESAVEAMLGVAEPEQITSE
ncbi:MAG: hypothetical protein WAS54_07640 [Scrofimicrobium sp.]